MAVARYNAFRDNLGNEHIEHRAVDTPEYHSAVTRLGEHMLAISDNPQGSDPAEYLSLPDAYELSQAVGKLNEASKSNGGIWPGAIDLEMRSMRGVRLAGPLLLDKIPVWQKPLNDAKNWKWLANRTYFPRRGEPHKGFIIGELGTSRKQLVALCQEKDGGYSFRSFRNGRTLRQSKGAGWGKLPELEYLTPALATGQSFGVDFNNRRGQSITEILKEKSGNWGANYKPQQIGAFKQAGQALQAEAKDQLSEAWADQKESWRRQRAGHRLARQAIKAESAEQIREAWGEEKLLWSRRRVAHKQARGALKDEAMENLDQAVLNQQVANLRTVNRVKSASRSARNKAKNVTSKLRRR